MKTGPLGFREWMVCAVAGMMVCSVASADTYTVTEDTYIDGRNTTTNYGGANGLRVFVNSVNPQPCHALLDIPDAIGSIPAGNLAQVQLWVYNYGGTALTRPIELHPLTTSFTEGGATWNTYDGTHAWTTAGGDYGANHVDVTAPVTDQWYAFDITAMLKGSDRTDLLNNGLLLKVFNDTVAPSSTTGQNFVSSENASYLSYHPYFAVTTVPEPASLALLSLGGLAILKRRKRRVSRAG